MDGTAKLRYVLATRGETLRRVATALVVIGIVGVTLTMAFPPTTTVTEITDRASVETETATGATVQGEHELYDEGETLTDEPVYIRGVTPEVTISANTRAPPAGVEVDTEVALVYEATTRDGTVFRERRRVLATASGTVDSDDDVIETTATLNTTDVATTLAAMREEIGDAGEVTAYVAIETDYAAADYDGTLAEREALQITDESFALPTITASADHHTTETTAEPIADRVFQPTLPAFGTIVVPHTTPAFLVAALLGLVGLGAVRRSRGAIDPEQARVQIHHRRYEEWISRGTLPPTLGEWTTDIAVESLEGLVDVAIDTDTRVIYDASKNRYAVVTDGATYVFSPEDADPDPATVSPGDPRRS